MFAQCQLSIPSLPPFIGPVVPQSRVCLDLLVELLVSKERVGGEEVRPRETTSSSCPPASRPPPPPSPPGPRDGRGRGQPGGPGEEEGGGRVRAALSMGQRGLYASTLSSCRSLIGGQARSQSQSISPHHALGRIAVRPGACDRSIDPLIPPSFTRWARSSSCGCRCSSRPTGSFWWVGATLPLMRHASSWVGPLLWLP